MSRQIIFTKLLINPIKNGYILVGQALLLAVFAFADIVKGISQPKMHIVSLLIVDSII